MEHAKPAGTNAYVLSREPANAALNSTVLLTCYRVLLAWGWLHADWGGFVPDDILHKALH